MSQRVHVPKSIDRAALAPWRRANYALLGFGVFGLIVMRATGLVIRSLIVGLLLFGNVPAWKHAHPGGDSLHSHHDHDCADHVAGASHAHTHFTLLGIEFTWPAPAESDDEPEQGQPTFLVAAPSAVECGQTPSHPLPLEVPILDGVQPVQVAPQFRCKTASAAPLCDIARHERSGVLLI